MSVKTTTERQADHRRRKKEQGLTEVRGIWARPESHGAIKAFAKSMKTTPWVAK